MINNIESNNFTININKDEVIPPIVNEIISNNFTININKNNNHINELFESIEVITDPNINGGEFVRVAIRVKTKKELVNNTVNFAIESSDDIIVKNIQFEKSNILTSYRPSIYYVNDKNDELELDLIEIKHQVEGAVKFVDLETAGSTIINGDNIITGTISGVKVITRSEGSRAEFVNDGITFYQDATQIGTMSYDTENKLWLRSNNGYAVKIESSDNMSIATPDNKNIYLSSNRTLFSTDLTLTGNSTFNGAVTINGNITSTGLTVNGTTTSNNIKANSVIMGVGNIRLDKDNTYLPQVSNTINIERIRIGDIYLAGASSGHFVTKSGGIPTMYLGNAMTTNVMSSDGVVLDSISKTQKSQVTDILSNITFEQYNPITKDVSTPLIMNVTNINNTNFVQVDEYGTVFSNDHELLKLALFEIQKLKQRMV